MKNVFNLIIILPLIGSCSSNERNELPADVKLETGLTDKQQDSGLYHFPAELMIDSLLFYEPDVIKIDSSRLEWFSRILRMMEEPPLYTKKENKEVYRFTWLRAFHPEIVISLEKVEGNVYLIEKKANPVDYSKVPISGTADDLMQLERGVGICDKKELAYSVWKKFESLIYTTSFKNLSTTIANDRSVDGANWILEMYKPTDYHFVTRWNPTEQEHKEMKALGDFLIDISQFEEEMRY